MKTRRTIAGALGARLAIATLLAVGAACGAVATSNDATRFAALAATGRPAGLAVPTGFQVRVLVAGLSGPRFMAFSPAGDLFVSCPRAGSVMEVPAGHPGALHAWATGLNLPHGLAWHGGALYVAETGAIARLEPSVGGARAARKTVLREDLPPGGMHWTRTLVFGPDNQMYVSIGSDCNACQEPDPRRAAVMRYDDDARTPEIYARGLRNAVGLAFRPGTSELWGTENGRDWLGDNLPPDELNRIEGGAHYGWPYCYGDRHPDPQHARPDFCPTTRLPAWKFQAHSAPLGLCFYTGHQFPPDYQGDLFVCFHGSWNRSVPTGYKVVRVRFKNGRPASQQDFLTGFRRDGQVRGRPVDVITAPDGSLYVSDDLAGRIYRVSTVPAR